MLLINNLLQKSKLHKLEIISKNIKHELQNKGNWNSISLQVILKSPTTSTLYLAPYKVIQRFYILNYTLIWKQ